MLLGLLLNKFSPVRWRRILYAGVTMAFVLLLIQCYLQHVALANAELAYQNPKTIEHVRTESLEGPVHIETRLVETPDRVELVIVEDRGPVSVIRESQITKEPIFQTAPRSDRWLAGISANPFDYRDSRSWGAYVGYGFRNRIDLLCGYSNDNPSMVVIFRF